MMITWLSLLYFCILEQQFKFQKPLKSIKVTENQEISLECELDDWEGQVKWFKGDKELKPDPVWVHNIENITFFINQSLQFPNSLNYLYYLNKYVVTFCLRVEQVAQVRRRKLVFKGVRLSDEGKYTCKSNADSTVCELIVERKQTFILALLKFIYKLPHTVISFH